MLRYTSSVLMTSKEHAELLMLAQLRKHLKKILYVRSGPCISKVWCAYLLVEGDLLHVCAGLGGQVSLLGSNWGGASQGQVVVEGGAKGSPGVKETFQAPEQLHSDTHILGQCDFLTWRHPSFQHLLRDSC